MGRLVRLRDLGLDATWYFEDAYWTTSAAGSYQYAWPSKNFPYQLCMHRDEFQHASRKLEIRRWIENLIPDTVIFDSVEMDYKKYYGKSYEWEKKYDVQFKSVFNAIKMLMASDEAPTPALKTIPGFKPEK